VLQRRSRHKRQDTAADHFHRRRYELSEHSIPYYEHIGFDIVSRDDGTSIVRLPYKAQLGNSRAHVHGGALSSLLDVSMSQALRSVLLPSATVMTIDLSVHFLAPARGDIIGHGRVVQCGKTIAFVEASLRDDEQNEVARGQGTFRVRLPRENDQCQEEANSNAQ
jgi:uncharacterized protein (TIGR00369 family)